MSNLLNPAVFPDRYMVADGVAFDPCLVSVSGLPGTPMYVIDIGGGYSCRGLEVARREASAVMAWIGEPVDLSQATPAEVWKAHTGAMARGATFHGMTGKRCPANLVPALVGLEGRRVEVVTPTGERSRFIVGKSTGWMPSHLEIKRRNSSGGPSAYVPEGSTVRVVG